MMKKPTINPINVPMELMKSSESGSVTAIRAAPVLAVAGLTVGSQVGDLTGAADKDNHGANVVGDSSKEVVLKLDGLDEVADLVVARELTLEVVVVHMQHLQATVAH